MYQFPLWRVTNAILLFNDINILMSITLNLNDRNKKKC